MVKEAVLEHFRFHPQSLLVIEEYDKLSCRTRGLLRQLIDSTQSTNVTVNKYTPLPEPSKICQSVSHHMFPMSALTILLTILHFHTFTTPVCLIH